MKIRQTQKARHWVCRPPGNNFIECQTDHRILHQNSRHDGEPHCLEPRCAEIDANLSREGWWEPHGILRFLRTRGCASGSWYRRYAPCCSKGHIGAIRGSHLNLKANETEHSIYGNEDAGSVYICGPNNTVREVRIEYWREAQRGDPNAFVAGLKTKHRGRTRRPPAHPILTCVQSRQYRGCMISKNWHRR